MAWEKLRADSERYARFLASGRESYARHPETGYLYALNWRGLNRERVRANNRAASARRIGHTAGGEVDAVKEYALILLRDPCSYCGGPADVIDHIEPLATAGAHSASNLTAACRRCNARKRTVPLLAFLLRHVEQQQLQRAA